MTAAHVNALMDDARAVAQYAAAWNLDLFTVSTTEFDVKAQCGNVDHARRLAAGFNLHHEDVSQHDKPDGTWVHVRWSDPSSPLVVVVASRAEQVAS